ncbi:MAG TPA: tyrosine-type recombinase/integrase [Solirubrobacterales bacterium]|jgi:integrase|nr:tyrosine-type recombinase/integrase [Solirubrobacterales bacterium]
MSSIESRSALADRPVKSAERPKSGAPAKKSGKRRRRKDDRRLVKTKTPRIYKRIGPDGKIIDYCAIVEVEGKQRKKYAKTYGAAKELKRNAETDRDRGELQKATTIRFLKYLDEWVERYKGQGRRGFRPHTRDEYRRLIRAYAHEYFSDRVKLVEVTAYLLARFVDWLADEEAQGKCLSDQTIANIVNPVKSALKSAEREGLIRFNPSQGLALPHREEDPDEDEEEEVKVFSRAELAAVLSMAPERYRLLLEILAGCGLRISEALALQRLHFQLDADKPEVCIRRAWVKGRIVPPKSKRGRREVPLSPSLVLKIRAYLDTHPREATDFFFASRYGGPLNADNLRKRTLKPLVEEVGASWAAFHTFRHTFASLHIAEGTNIEALSRVLGHHSAAFTLSRYTHLLPGEDPPAIDLATALPFGQSAAAELLQLVGAVA